MRRPAPPPPSGGGGGGARAGGGRLASWLPPRGAGGRPRASCAAPPGGRMRMGLLGTGPWALLASAPALRGPPEVDFTGVWGRRPEAAGVLADRFGTRAYADVDALVADSDAIAIALPPAVQAPLAVR